MKKIIRFFSVRTLPSKIGLILSLTLVFMLLVINFIFMRMFDRLLMDSAEKKAQEITGMFAMISSVPLVRFDYYALEQNVIELQKNEDILFAHVYDRDSFLLTLSSSAGKSEDSGMTKVYEAKIDNEQGETIGSVAVGFDMWEIAKTMQRYRLALYGSSFLIVSITFLILLFLINYVVSKPLNLLMNSVNRISGGDIDHKVEINSADELGDLAGSFNLMTSRLKSSISTINCIVESMPSALITVDRELAVLEWNQSAEQMFGIEKQEAVGKSLFGLYPGLEAYKEEINAVLMGRKVPSLLKDSLFDNRSLIYEISLFPLRNEEIEGIVIRIDDITEGEKRKQQLIQAQKMESIGNLAGGLAHNLNNILAGIIGTTTFLEYKLETNQDIKRELLTDKLKIMDDAGQRASDLIKELLSLSGRHKSADYDRHDLNSSLQNVLKICESSFEKTVEIKAELYDGEAWYNGNSSQIEQVILNICINAYHSMTIMRKPDETAGGKLSISISEFLPDLYFSDIHKSSKYQKYWLLTISDTGVGMDKETQTRIFDPFFTTKEKNQGTGLGLSMVFSLIKQHSGIIGVYSEPGEGSTFKLYLPAVKSSGGTEKKPSGGFGSCLKKGEGSVLVIDDEESIRSITREMLMECGYTVYSAGDGEEGIRIFREKKDEIMLIILDRVMPGKSGEEALRELRGISTGVRIVMTSGFRHDREKDFSSYGHLDGFLSKPFTITELSGTIHDILSKGHGG